MMPSDRPGLAHLQPAYADIASSLLGPAGDGRRVVFLGLQDYQLDLLRRARAAFGDFDLVLEHRGRTVGVLAYGAGLDLHSTSHTRRVSLAAVRVRCPDAWGETYCWRHSARYRAACRRDPDIAPWEVIYGPGVCAIAHR